MEQLALPFLYTMTEDDCCGTCQYTEMCNHFDPSEYWERFSHECIYTEYSYSRKRGMMGCYYNNWKPMEGRR
jgi:hypothetical protein